MDKELRNIQLCQLDLALEVKRICERNNIKYFLIGGTLLGAFRHGGFIPWDDDLDIGMLREDYNNFIRVCSKTLHKDYFLQTAFTDRDFGFAFTKIKINGTQYVEEIAQKNNSHKGVFIDIFPFDNMPVDIKEQKKHYKRVQLLRNLLLYKCNYLHWDKTNKKKQVMTRFLTMITYLLSKNRILNRLIKEETKYKGYSTKNVINLEGAYRYKEYMPSDCIIKTETINFENYEFSIPSNPEIYLLNLYGDFMKLPPEDKRYNRHGVIDIKLDTYKIKNEKAKELINDAVKKA